MAVRGVAIGALAAGAVDSTARAAASAAQADADQALSLIGALEDDGVSDEEMQLAIYTAETDSAPLTINLSAGGDTIDAAEWNGATSILFTGHSAARTVVVTGGDGIKGVKNAGTGAGTVTLQRGSSTQAMAAGSIHSIHNINAENRVVSTGQQGTTGPLAVSAGGTGATTVAGIRQQIDVLRSGPCFAFSGAMSDADVAGPWVAAEACQIPASLAGTRVKALTNPGGTITLTLQKNGVAITNGTIQVTSGGVVTLGAMPATSLAVGDSLSLHGPATADATVRSLSVTIPLNV